MQHNLVPAMPFGMQDGPVNVFSFIAFIIGAVTNAAH